MCENMLFKTFSCSLRASLFSWNDFLRHGWIIKYFSILCLFNKYVYICAEDFC